MEDIDARIPPRDFLEFIERNKDKIDMLEFI